jgi:putative pyruvate formate lyase activating enzyme
MTQYTPVPKSGHSAGIDAFPDRPFDRDEYNALMALVEKLDIDTGFYQELVEDTEWLPDFNRTQPFSSALARPVWHWTTGFIG